MKTKLVFSRKVIYTIFVVSVSLVASCSMESDSSIMGYDASLYGEWVEDDGSYVWAYYSFYRDGTGIEGSYEPDIDLVNEDSDIEWYTVDDEWLYIDGAPYEYWCDGTSLEIIMKGRTRYFREK